MLPSLLFGLDPDLHGFKEKYLLARISLLPLMHILDYPDHLWNNHPAPVLLLWSFLFYFLIVVVTIFFAVPAAVAAAAFVSWYFSRWLP